MLFYVCTLEPCWDIDWLSGLRYGIVITVWINSRNDKIQSHEVPMC